MTTVEGTPCACRFNGNGERLQECAEHADLRARLYAAEDRCDEHVAAMVEVADVLDAADGETAMWAARRAMARLAELEQQVADARTESAALLAAVREIEAGTSCELVTIGAYCERFGDKPIVVHPDRLDGIWRAIKARAECAMKWAAGALDSRARCEQLEQQVAALADALRHAVTRNHEASDGCDACARIRDALRAAGSKT